MRRCTTSLIGGYGGMRNWPSVKPESMRFGLVILSCSSPLRTPAVGSGFYPLSSFDRLPWNLTGAMRVNLGSAG